MTTDFSLDRVGRARLRVPMAARSFVALAALGVATFALEPELSRAQVDLGTSLMLYIAAASAWNIIGGFAGQFSLANSAFVGAGSYITVMILRNLGWQVLPALLVAGIGGVILSVAMGLILFRLRNEYFTIGSMAVALAALTWMSNWNFTGASTGISAPFSLAPDPSQLYLIGLGIAVLAVAASIGIFHSSLGLRLMAVRDDQDVADSLGLSPLRLKVIAIAVSGFLTSIVGGAIALQQITIEPFSAFSINWSITFIVMAIVGGLGRVWGPALGAIIIYSGLTVPLQNFPTVSTIVEGVLLIVLIKVLPGGLLGGGSAALARLRGRRKIG